MKKIVKCIFRNVKPATLDSMLVRMPRRYKCESRCMASGDATVIITKCDDSDCGNYDLQVAKDVLYMVNSEYTLEDEPENNNK